MPTRSRLHAALGLAVLACASLADRAGAGQEPRPVLTIDGVAVGADVFGRWLIENRTSTLARRFAEDWAVAREARRVGVELAPGVVEARWEAEVAERIAGAFRGDRAGWLAELERTGRSAEGVRLQRELELIPEELARAIAAVDRVVPPELIEREWEARHGRHGLRFDLSWIRVDVPVPSTEVAGDRERARALREAALGAGRARALAARERLLAGEPFADVARELSDDAPSRENGGRPPAGFRHEGWPTGFLDALEALEVGELSPPLFARGGYWVVRVDDVASTPLATVRERIVADLLERGPGPYEIGLVRRRLSGDLSVEALPSLFETETSAAEGTRAVPGLRIDGELVPRDVFARWLLQARGESSVPAFVEHWAVERAARDAGLTVSEEEVEARLQSDLERTIRLAHDGRREAWVAHVTRNGGEAMALAALRARTRIDLLTERLIVRDRVVDEGAVRARWRDVYGDEGWTVEARWILCRAALPWLEPGATPEDLRRASAAAQEEARARATALRARLAAGEDFAALALEHSDEPDSASRGGRLPGRFRPETWEEPVARAVAALEVGLPSDVLATSGGFAVFEVLRRVRTPFEEVRDALAASMRTERPSSAELAGYRNALTRGLDVRRP